MSFQAHPRLLIPFAGADGGQRRGIDAHHVAQVPTCPDCGRRLSRLSGQCGWCPRNARDRAEATPTVFSPVQHRVEIACLTCSRPVLLAEARATAGRCRACGGTLVLNELP